VPWYGRASRIYACATHGILSKDSIDRIAGAPILELVLTDSVPLPPEKRIPQITTLSVAPLIGEAIRRIHRGESVGALFSSEASLTQEMILWEDGVEQTLDARTGAILPPEHLTTRHDPEHPADVAGVAPARTFGDR